MSEIDQKTKYRIVKESIAHSNKSKKIRPKNSKEYIKVRPFEKTSCMFELDYDYNEVLSAKDKKWLTSFYKDYLDGNFNKDDEKSCFYNSKIIDKIYRDIKSHPKKFKKLKAELKREQQRRKRLFNKHKEKEYIRHCKEGNNPEDFEVIVSMRYKTLTIKEWIIVKQKRYYRNLVRCRREDVISRDSFNSDVLEFNEEIDTDRDRTKNHKRFLFHYNNKMLDVYIYEELLFLVDYFSTLPENGFFTELRYSLVNFKHIYDQKKIRKRDYYYYLYTVLKSLTLKAPDMKSDELDNTIMVLDNIYKTQIFIKDKKDNLKKVGE